MWAKYEGGMVRGEGRKEGSGGGMCMKGARPSTSEKQNPRMYCQVTLRATGL